jgi:hypothetical protein
MALAAVVLPSPNGRRGIVAVAAGLAAGGVASAYLALPFWLAGVGAAGVALAARELALRVPGRREWLGAVPLSLLLAAMAVVGRHIVVDNRLDAETFNSITPFGAADAAIALVIAASLGAALVALARWTRRLCASRLGAGSPGGAGGGRAGNWLFASPEAPVARRRWWAVFSGAIALGWVPYLLICWPGSAQIDSLNSIYQATGEFGYNNHHPIVFTLLLGAFFKLAAALGWSANAALAMFTLLQSAVMATACGYGAYWLLRQARLRLWTAIAVTAYFALTPLFAVYGQMAQKDTLFSTCLFLLALLCGEAVATRGASLARGGIVRLALVTLGVTVFRNGGVVIGGVIAIVLVIAFGRRAIAAAATAAILAAGAQGAIMAAGSSGLINASDAAVESLAVPIQQAASVVARGGRVTDGQAAFLATMAPLDHFKTSYTPQTFDSLKFNEQFDNSSLRGRVPEFLRVWAGMGLANPGKYLQAQALETYGFWVPGAKSRWGFMPTGVAENWLGLEPKPVIRSWLGWDFESLAARADFLGAGTLAWIMLVGAFLAARVGGWRWLAPFAPTLILWVLLLFTTPIAFSFRYVFSLALVLPWFLLLPLAACARPDPAASISPAACARPDPAASISPAACARPDPAAPISPAACARPGRG